MVAASRDEQNNGKKWQADRQQHSIAQRISAQHTTAHRDSMHTWYEHHVLRFGLGGQVGVDRFVVMEQGTSLGAGIAHRSG